MMITCAKCLSLRDSLEPACPVCTMSTSNELGRAIHGRISDCLTKYIGIPNDEVARARLAADTSSALAVRDMYRRVPTGECKFEVNVSALQKAMDGAISEVQRNLYAGMYEIPVRANYDVLPASAGSRSKLQDVDCKECHHRQNHAETLVCLSCGHDQSKPTIGTRLGIVQGERGWQRHVREALDEADQLRERTSGRSYDLAAALFTKRMSPEAHCIAERPDAVGFVRFRAGLWVGEGVLWVMWEKTKRDEREQAIRDACELVDLM